nr:MAG TPA: hypothetical protein [Bacteriophage sp.]
MHSGFGERFFESLSLLLKLIAYNPNISSPTI